MLGKGKRGVVGLILLWGALGCETRLEPALPDLRRKTLEAVSPRLDARGARLETQRAKALFVVKVWMRDSPQGAERLKATCWFDDQHRLLTVVYAS